MSLTVIRGSLARERPRNQWIWRGVASAGRLAAGGAASRHPPVPPRSFAPAGPPRGGEAKVSPSIDGRRLLYDLHRSSRLVSCAGRSRRNHPTAAFVASQCDSANAFLGFHISYAALSSHPIRGCLFFPALEEESQEMPLPRFAHRQIQLRLIAGVSLAALIGLGAVLPDNLQRAFAADKQSET